MGNLEHLINPFNLVQRLALLLYALKKTLIFNPCRRINFLQFILKKSL